MRHSSVAVCLILLFIVPAVGSFSSIASAQGIDVREERTSPPNAGPSRAPAPGTNPRWILWGLVNKQNGQPLPSGQVTLKDPSGASQSFTIRDGQWTGVTIAGRYEVTISVDGFEPVSASFDTRPWTANAYITGKMDPKPAANRGLLAVAVLEQGTDTPLAGANVSVTGPGGTRTAVTGPPQTTAVFQNLSSGAYKVSASLAGYDSGTADAQVTSPQSSVSYVRLKRGGGQTTVRVTVQSNFGSPVNGADVTVSGPGFRTTAKTGPDGIAKVGVAGASVTIDVAANTYAPSSLSNYRVGSNAGPTIVLSQPYYELAIAVTNAAGPVRNGQIDLKWPLGAMRTNTDGQGMARLKLLPGDQTVTVTGPGGQKGTMSGKLTGPTTWNIVLR